MDGLHFLATVDFLLLLFFWCPNHLVLIYVTYCPDSLKSVAPTYSNLGCRCLSVRPCACDCLSVSPSVERFLPPDLWWVRERPLRSLRPRACTGGELHICIARGLIEYLFEGRFFRKRGRSRVFLALFLRSTHILANGWPEEQKRSYSYLRILFIF